MGEGLKGVRVLVTGATGFLGQHMCRTLSAMGAEPLPVSRSLGFDLTDEARAVAAFLVAKPAIAIHLAAPRDGAPPVSAVRDPILMGLNVLGACAMARAKAIMVCRHGPPDSPQHAVRQALLAAARAHRREHGLQFVQLVPCDMYGPLDHDGRLRLVPSIVSDILDAKAKDAKELVLPGDGERPFPLLYVGDAAKAIAAACALPGCDEPLELCGPEALRLGQISAVAAKCAGFQGKVEWDPRRPSSWRETGSQDGAVAREVLDWEAATGVEQGLKATLEWISAGRKANP